VPPLALQKRPHHSTLEPAGQGDIHVDDVGKKPALAAPGSSDPGHGSERR
jgi:hypothetical protein